MIRLEDTIAIENIDKRELLAKIDLRGTQLNMALSAFFVTSCVSQIPVDVLLKRMSPHVFGEC